MSDAKRISPEEQKANRERERKAANESIVRRWDLKKEKPQ